MEEIIILFILWTELTRVCVFCALSGTWSINTQNRQKRGTKVKTWASNDLQGKKRLQQLQSLVSTNLREKRLSCKARCWPCRCDAPALQSERSSTEDGCPRPLWHPARTPSQSLQQGWGKQTSETKHSHTLIEEDGSGIRTCANGNRAPPSAASK